MLILLSPAKKLNMNSKNFDNLTQPLFLKDTFELIKIVRKLSIQNFQKLMNLSPNLAELNLERFSKFGDQNKKASLFTFAGDTYQGLDAETFSNEDINWAQEHLIIISGLYGFLRPLDEIEPYRLEMGSRLETKRGNSLYSFWGSQLSEELSLQANKIKTNIILNCASNEYFKAVDNSKLMNEVITPIFKENKQGKSKIISFYAKKARGMMARFVIQNRLTKIDELKNFNLDGYVFNQEQSSKSQLVFIR
ncbi:MAG: hypothetical protein CBC19_04555 [Oceanospirillales bacterium TMED59]|nr:MAG: hypothetical protein CBC19_04555 [Oceanospirillales bacterium TMED59]